MKIQKVDGTSPETLRLEAENEVEAGLVDEIWAAGSLNPCMKGKRSVYLAILAKGEIYPGIYVESDKGRGQV